MSRKEWKIPTHEELLRIIFEVILPKGAPPTSHQVAATQAAPPGPKLL
jgi:hypothetical protein